MNADYDLHVRRELYMRSEHGQRFPDSVPWVTATGRWLYANWTGGADYRAPEHAAVEGAAPFYGAYPRWYLPRMAALFPDAARTLHLFAGSLPRGPYVRVDLHADRADVVADAAHLEDHFEAGAFDFVLADPPYSAEDAVKYDTPMISRPAVLRSTAHVIEPGGFLVWLDVQLPIFRKTEWHWCGDITLIRSSNHRRRGAAVFQRQ